MTDERYDVFLSYARNDEADFLAALRQALVQAGVDLWYDRDSMPNRGMTFGQEIRRAIERSSRLVLVLGPHARSSVYVTQEWQHADNLGIPIVPVWRDDLPLPERLADYHAVDARDNRRIDDALAELVRVLRQPIRPLGRRFRVPPLAPSALPRGPVVAELTRFLIADQLLPADAGSTLRAAMLYGISGAGKSTAAIQFADAPRTRRAFPDGIGWVHCGPGFTPLRAARTLLSGMAPGARLPEDLSEIAGALADGLSGRDVLVVLDDVRDAAEVALFLAVAGPGGRVLLTGPDRAQATALGAIPVQCGMLDRGDSRRLLEEWTGEPLPSEADEVVAACDGLPFALATVGAMIANGVRWSTVVAALDSRRLDLLEAQSSTTFANRSVLGVMTAAYESLAAADARAARGYLELAAFHLGSTLSIEVIVRLWSRPEALSALEAQLVLPILERRLLLTPVDGGFRLHRLHEEFVRLRCTEREQLESALVDSYRREKGTGAWSALRDDGYVFDHVLEHLVSVGAREEALAAVDEGWVRRQLTRTGDPGQAYADLARMLELASESPIAYQSMIHSAVLAGQVMNAWRSAPVKQIMAAAQIGDTHRAVRWAAGRPDPGERIGALAAVADVLLANGDVTDAAMVVRSAAESIPLLGGYLGDDLRQQAVRLYAIDRFVHFPPQGEGPDITEEALVSAAAPVAAVMQLADAADRAGALEELTNARNHFWEPYGSLLCLVVVELLAAAGAAETAAHLLDAASEPDGHEEVIEAYRYRRVVAEACVGRLAISKEGLDRLDSFRAVGVRGWVRYAARAGEMPAALQMLTTIEQDDPETAQLALADVFEDALAYASPDNCRALAEFLDASSASMLLLAAAGEPAEAMDLLERLPSDDFPADMRFGLKLVEALERTGDRDNLVTALDRLQSFAEGVAGEMWPSIDDLPPEWRPLVEQLLTALIRNGRQVPDLVGPAYQAEIMWGGAPAFKMTLIRALATSGRVDEATTLARTAALPETMAAGLSALLETAGLPEDQLDQLVDAVEQTKDPAVVEMAVTALLGRGHAGRVERILRHDDLRSPAIGAYTLHLARIGDHAGVRDLLDDALLRQLPNPDVTRRAYLLVSVAAAKPGGTELDQTISLLSDPLVAGAALDVVFEVVLLHAAQHGPHAAAELVNRIPGGETGQFLTGLATTGYASHPLSLSRLTVGAARAARTVATAAAAVAASNNGDPDATAELLHRAETLLNAMRMTDPGLGGPAAVARYIGTARLLAGQDAPPIDDATADIAWLLWQTGHRDQAIGLAEHGLANLRSVFDGRKVIRAADSLHILDMINMLRLRLLALLLIDAIDHGAADQATELVETLTTLDIVEVRPDWRVEAACAVALASRRFPSADGPMSQPDRWWAIASAVVAELVAMGDVRRLTVVGPLLAALPQEQATQAWTDWIRVAAANGAEQTLGVIGQSLRWLPAIRDIDMPYDLLAGQLT